MRRIARLLEQDHGVLFQNTANKKDLSDAIAC